MKIVTNGRYRPVVYFDELPEQAKAWWSHLTGKEDCRFVKYRGDYLLLNDYLPVPEHAGLDDWQGYDIDSLSSGTLISYDEYGEFVKVGFYCV